MRLTRSALRSLSFMLLCTALLVAGCDSNGGGPEDDLGNNTTFSFADANPEAVSEGDGDTYELTVVVNDPGFKDGLSVTVAFDAEASTADFSEISGIEQTTTLTFPESATDGDRQTLTFEIEDDDEQGEMAEQVVFALQGAQQGSVGDPGTYTLTVNDDDLLPIPIAEARAMADGELVAVEGVVTRVEGSNVRIQDESGDDGATGIVVRDDALADALESGDVEPGDRIQAMGTLDSFNGLKQLSGDDVRYMVVEEDAGLPEPAEVTLTELSSNGESYESELVTVEDLSFVEASGSFEGGTNYTVTSEDDTELSLRVTGDSFYAGLPIPGGAFAFTGVLGQFSESGEGGYQLLTIADGDLDTGEPPLSTIAEARALDDGTAVTVEGVFTRIEGSNARIQDESGDDGATGIVVRDDALETAVADGDVEPGDRLRVTGGLGSFNGLKQISSSVSFTVVEEDAGLPEPVEVSLSEISSNGEAYESELVEVEGLTFSTDEETFATDGGDGFGNYTVTDEDGTEGIVRIPGGSFYDGTEIPDDAVVFAGVVGQFDSSEMEPLDEGYQLLAIAEGDLEEGEGDGGGDVNTIAEARSMIGGDPVTIRGIVTSVGDDEARVQDATAGIFISRREDFASAVERGDQVEITGSVSEFANQTQIDSDNLTTFTVLSSGNDLPEAAPLDNLGELNEAVESERVRVEGVIIDAGDDDVFQAGGSEGNYAITGADGNERILRIPSGSFYEGVEIPEGEVTLEAVAGQFNFDDPNAGYQIIARYEGQIIADGDGDGDGETLLSENFDDESLDPFTTVSLASSENWEIGSFDGATFARVSGFGADEASDDWLISPAFNFAEADDERFAFTTAKGFDGPDLQVLISTSYAGDGTPDLADFTDITDRVRLAANSDKPEGESFTPFIPSGEIDLTDESFQAEAVYIAFRYVSDGTEDGEAATWEVDDVVVAEGSATDGDGFPEPPGRP